MRIFQACLIMGFQSVLILNSDNPVLLAGIVLVMMIIISWEASLGGDLG